MAHDTEVLIVGAGPTGLVLAASLARSGVRTRLVDKDPARSDRSRALVVHARSLELLARLGAAAPLVARGARSVRVELRAGGRVAASFDLGDVGAEDTPYPFILFVSQAETERVLLDRARALGVVEERGVEFLSHESRDGGVVARLRGPCGEEAARARYLVGCDGAHSAVRKSAGLRFEGDPYPQDFILADAVVDFGERVSEPALRLYLSRHGIAALFPMPGGLHRVISSRPESAPEGALEPTLDEFADALRSADAGACSLRDPRWLARFRLHHRGVDAYRAGSVFVAGDAAHIHSPAGGQGMNTGMQDAENLAWKLALVLRGGAREDLLDSYHAERHPVGRRLLRTTDRLFEFATSRNSIVAALRTFVLPRVAPRLLATPRRRRRAFRFLSQLGIRYRRSPIVAEGSRGFDGGPPPGSRAPDGPLVDSRTGAPSTLFERLAAPSHHLLTFSGGDAGACPPDCSRALALAPRDVVRPLVIERRALAAAPGAALDSDGVLHRRYGLAGPGLYVIRPDGHVGFRSAGTETDSLVSWLRRMFETSPA